VEKSTRLDRLVHDFSIDSTWQIFDRLHRSTTQSNYYYYYLFITPLRQHKIQAYRTHKHKHHARCTIKKIYKIKLLKLQLHTQWCHKRLCHTVTASFILSLVDAGLTPYLSSSSSTNAAWTIEIKHNKNTRNYTKRHNSDYTNLEK